MSIKLTDTQFVLLSAAAQRKDLCLVAPPTLKGATAQKVASKLISAGFVKEVKAKASDPIWRRDEESGASYALKLTAAGAKAIAVDDPAEPEDVGEESDASYPVKVGRQGRSTCRSNGAWSYTPICSTRRLEARASHRIASSRSWRDH